MKKIWELKKSWKLMICGLMVLLIAILTIRPTLAWLSASSDPVVNYFTGGCIGIKIDEGPVDEHGKHCDGDRVTENHYKFIPGCVLDKDPMVTVLADSERCYVYVCVINELPEQYFDIDFKEDAWTLIVTDRSMSIYRYESIVESSEEDQALTPIFTQISVSSDLDYDMIKSLGSRQLSVTAYAVQADSIEQDTADTLAEEYFRENVEITDVEPIEPSEPSKPDKPHKTTSTIEGDAEAVAESEASEESSSAGAEDNVSSFEETGAEASNGTTEATEDNSDGSSSEEASTTEETGTTEENGTETVEEAVGTAEETTAEDTDSIIVDETAEE